MKKKAAKRKRKPKTSKKSAEAGAKNLAKWKADNPEEAKAAAQKHGAFCAHIRERYSDERTVEGKRLKAVIDSLSQDIGGDLTPAQQAILGFLRSQFIVIWQISDYMDRQLSILDDSGALLPCLRQSLLSYEEAAARNLERLYGFNRQRQGKIPTLKQLLSENHGR